MMKWSYFPCSQSLVQPNTIYINNKYTLLCVSLQPNGNRKFHLFILSELRFNIVLVFNLNVMHSLLTSFILLFDFSSFIHFPFHFFFRFICYESVRSNCRLSVVGIAFFHFSRDLILLVFFVKQTISWTSLYTKESKDRNGSQIYSNDVERKIWLHG